MSDTETPPAPTEGESKLESKVNALADKVAQLFDMFKNGAGDKGSETDPDQPASMSAEVRRELDKLRAEEARQQREAERDAEIGELKAKVTAARPPREYRKATNVMRWATENDR
jgi:hypothetical protein